jgi:FHA domain-containing protein
MSDLLTVEKKLRDWIDQLSDEHKQLLLTLLTEDDRLQSATRLDFVVTQVRRLCADRGVDWDEMAEFEREIFFDNLVRDNETYATQVGTSLIPTIAPCSQCGHRMTPSDLYRIYFGERPPSTKLGSAKLVILDGEDDEQYLIATDIEMVIGRNDPHRGIRPEVDLSKYDPASRVSRRHARITVRGDLFFVEDLGSANGTFINGNMRLPPREPYLLANGDVIQIGETSLKFVG